MTASFTGRSLYARRVEEPAHLSLRDRERRVEAGTRLQFILVQGKGLILRGEAFKR